MLEKEFHLGTFINKVNNADSLTEQHVVRMERMLSLYHDLFDTGSITQEMLTKYTLEDIEWVEDLIIYWPSYEMELEAEDYDHEGIQTDQIRDIIVLLSRQKSVRKKVTFI